jgi:hypothetical protein
VPPYSEVPKFLVSGKTFLEKKYDDYAAPLVLAFLILWFCQGLVLNGEVPFYRDLTNYFYPLRHSLYESYQAGELPLWDRHFAQGFPNLAALQIGAFYPPHATFLVLPFFVSIRLLFILHFLIAAFGVYTLLRSWSYPRNLSLVGALLFTLGGVIVSLTNLLNHFQSAVWLPWLIFAWERLLSAPRWSKFVAFTLTAALQLLAGSPEIFAMSMGVVMLDGFRIRAAGLAVSVIRIVALWLVGTALMLSLVMAQILPTVELILESRRGQSIPAAEAFMWSLQPASLWNFFFIDKEADLSVPSGLRLFLGNKVPFLISSYMGLISMFGIALWSYYAERKEKLFLTALVFGSLAVALGNQALIYPLVYKYLPLVSTIRFPEKFFFLTYVFLFFMVMSGLKKLLIDHVGKAKIPLMILGAICLLWLGLYVTLMFRSEVVTDFIAVHSNLAPLSEAHTSATMSVLANLQRQAILALALFALIVLLKIEKIRPVLFSSLLVSVVFVDLAWAHRSLLFSMHPDRMYKFTPVISAADAASRRFFYYPTPRNLHPASYSVIGRPTFEQAVVLSFQNYLPNVGIMHGVDYFQEIDALNRRSYSDFLSVANNLDFERQVQLLRVFNVAYVVSFRELPEKGIRQIGRFPDYFSWLYHVERSVPRAYVVNQAIVEKDSLKALRRLSDPEFDPSKQVVLYDDVEVRATPSLMARVDIQHYTNNKVTIHTETAEDSIFVLADSIYPGWKAFIDGKETKILRANHFYRAVVLPKGEHQVEFRYEPLSFTLGLLISALTLTSIVVVSFALFLRRRRLKAPLLVQPVYIVKN